MSVSGSLIEDEMMLMWSVHSGDPDVLPDIEVIEHSDLQCLMSIFKVE
jgi:hypothetical protein